MPRSTPATAAGRCSTPPVRSSASTPPWRAGRRAWASRSRSTTPRRSSPARRRTWAPDAPYDLGTMHLLLVEDDERLARSLTRLLEEDRHVVEHAPDGRTGIELASALDGLDAVILDI